MCICGQPAAARGMLVMRLHAKGFSRGSNACAFVSCQQLLLGGGDAGAAYKSLMAHACWGAAAGGGPAAH